MTYFLSFAFAGIVAANAFFGVVAVRLLVRSALPGWRASKIVVPTYIILILIFLGFAGYFFFKIPAVGTASAGPRMILPLPYP